MSACIYGRVNPLKLEARKSWRVEERKLWGKEKKERGERRSRRVVEREGKEFNECIQNTTFPIPIYLIHPTRVFRNVIRYNKGFSTRKSSEILPFPPCRYAFRRILFFL